MGCDLGWIRFSLYIVQCDFYLSSESELEKGSASDQIDLRKHSGDLLHPLDPVEVHQIVHCQVRYLHELSVQPCVCGGHTGWLSGHLLAAAKECDPAQFNSV